jgi:hypothetical protein
MVVMVIVMNAIVSVSSSELERYRALVADMEGLTDAQKDEAIEIVVGMMQAFVDAAWGQHPVQLAQMAAGEWPSQSVGFCDSLSALGKAKPIDLVSEGANTQNKKEECAP